jgi:hypothetical protein
MAQGWKDGTTHPEVEADQLQLQISVSEREAIVAKGYSFNTANRNATEKTVRHMKTRFRRGLNVASGNFPAGSNVRIIHRSFG